MAVFYKIACFFAWSWRDPIYLLYGYCICITKQDTLTGKKRSFLCSKMLKCVQDFDVHK